MKRKSLVTILLVLTSALSAQETSKAYLSGLAWSGQCANWGGWATYTTPPAPAGYIVAAVSVEMGGDPTRGCMSWGECSHKVNSDQSVTVQWRSQGHSEDCTFHTLAINTPYSTLYNGRIFTAYQRGAGSTQTGVRVTLTYRKQ